MRSRLNRFLQSFLDVDQHELLKVIYLSITFFLVIGAYTVTRELKDSVFTTIIGSNRSIFMYAKLCAMLFLIPAIFLHSRLVDLVRRHYLLYIYATSYAILGLVFVYFLGHPTIGLPNTASSPTRIFGWLFYFFIEGYAPLLVSVFWAFSNSITSPKAAKNNYAIMIAGSKLGGITCAASAFFLLGAGIFSDVVNLQVLLLCSSLLLCLVPIVVYYLIKKVPHKDLHGYEAAYQLEKERHRTHQDENISWYDSMLSGLILLFKYPYVMGIFGMTFFYELVSQAIKVENLIFAKRTSVTISGTTAFLLWQALLAHIVAFVVVIFGTRWLIGLLGERKALLLVPISTGLSLMAFVFKPSYITAVLAYVVTKSVNYALATPLRESLYIPTVKEVQFKSKSWIDGVGSKFAKTCAQSYNMYADGLIGTALLSVQASFFSGVVLCWFAAAYALGWRFEKAVKRNEVIGEREVISPS